MAGALPARRVGALKAKPLFGRPPNPDGRALKWIYVTVTENNSLQDEIRFRAMDA